MGDLTNLVLTEEIPFLGSSLSISRMVFSLKKNFKTEP
jgi:hypothetical protein